MKHFFLLYLIIFTSLTTLKSQNIFETIGNDSLALLKNGYIVGPNNIDCGNNVHTKSKWVNVNGVEYLTVVTLQHRNFDKSVIYDQNNNLLWSWNGENSNDTWYYRRHKVSVKGNLKVRIEFTQGFSDPYCNGKLQVVGISKDYLSGGTESSISKSTNATTNNFSSHSSRQLSSNICELNGSIFYSNCTKYIGDCQDGKANGWGELLLNNNNKMRGLFLDNKLQDFYLEYFNSDQNILIIGPNKESAFHGPCVNISNNFISFSNYENGRYMGNGDLFIIPQPDFNVNATFCDPDGYGSKDKLMSNLIPNTNYIIYTSSREYNSAGSYKHWLTVVDLSTNKIIRNFGSSEKPLTYNKAPSFIGFNKDNKPIYSYSGKFFQLDIANGISTSLNSIPIEITKKNDFINKILKSTYKDLGTLLDIGNLGKFYVFKDSSYVKLFNSINYLESVKNFKSQPGSGSSLVFFNKNHQVVSSLDLKNMSIYDFDIDEINSRIALSHASKDSTFLSYYDLKNLKLLSNIYKTPNPCENQAEVKFSKNGEFLFYKLKFGYSIYKDDRLYFGIPGDLYGLNEDETVAISNSAGNVSAYDLKKKIIIWTYKISDDYYNSKFIIQKNKIYIISGRAESWTGYKVNKNGIKLNSLEMPSPLISLSEFKKKPDEGLQSMSKSENITNGNKQSVEKSVLQKNNTGNNGVVNSQCNYKVTIPVIKWQIRDNRKLCTYCRSRYSIYRKADLEEEKKFKTMQLMQIRLDKHLESIKADDAHRESDNIRLKEFVVKNFKVDFFTVAAMISGSYFGKIFSMLNSDPEEGINKIDLYNIDSEFCSLKCKDDYKRYRY